MSVEYYCTVCIFTDGKRILKNHIFRFEKAVCTRNEIEKQISELKENYNADEVILIDMIKLDN